MTVNPWFAQPDDPLGTVILLPGGNGGTATPVMHWPATLLTQRGWSVLGVTWDESALARGAAGHVRRCADAVLERALPDRPVLVVAKSLGTLALPWAVENDLPGVWLTPLLREETVAAAVRIAQHPTLLVGGTADLYWDASAATGPGVTMMELPGANHGLQQPGDWRRSLLDQVAVFERIEQFPRRILNGQ